MIPKGTWVEVERVVLKVEERSNSIPEDTKGTTLKMWLKGYCLKDCNIGDEVEIETIIGRKEKGIVTDVEPSFNHDFGRYIKEISYIGRQAKEILFED